MLKTMFLIFFTVHIIADFYFQTEIMAEKKQTQYKWMLYHILVYGSCAMILFAIFLPGLRWMDVFSFVAAHALIDVVKYVICQSNCPAIKVFSLNKRSVFLIDQAIHLIVIVMIIPCAI